MYKAIIIDDESLARELVRKYLADFSSIEVVDECADGFEGLKAIQLHQPDVIFLDVQMPKVSGFELLELLENPPAIIFTTAFEEYAIKAFEANSIDYLLKPYSKERFEKAVKKFLQNVDKENHSVNVSNSLPIPNDRILVKIDSQIKIIPTSSIHYIEASGDYVKICSEDGKYMKNKTMQHIESVLNMNHFVRIHRSFIVNIEQITRIDAYEKETHLVVLKSGIQLPASRNGYQRLKDVLGI